MTPKTDELPRLEIRHQAALRFFLRVKQKDDLDECVAVLAAEDVRAEFDQAFKRFSQSLDMLLPSPKALRFLGDFKWLGKIRQAASARYRDKALDISDCGPKVRKLIEDAIIVEGIQILVARVNLFTPEFEQKLAALSSDDARASEMEHAIRDEIHVKLDEDPVFYSSLRQRLEQIIADRKARRIDAAEQLKLFATVTADLKGRAAAAHKLGLSETGYAILGLLAPQYAQAEAADDRPAYQGKRDLAAIFDDTLRQKTEIVDWAQKEKVQKEMRVLIKRQLRASNYGEEELDPLAEGIIDVLKRRQGK